MVKNGIGLVGASKQNALFFWKMCPKNTPMPSLSRIGPAFCSLYMQICFLNACKLAWEKNFLISM